MNLIRSDYGGYGISFDERDAWFNATEAAAHFGKKPIEWLRLPETERYLATLCDFHKVGKSHFVRTIRGTKSPGTWFAPKLAVPFARWCNVRFAIWCDDQIGKILRGDHPYFNWKRERSLAAASCKAMCEALQMVREEQGKETMPHHFANEARLLNSILTGEFAAVDRESLSDDDLDLLGRLEIRNMMLIAQGIGYQERKKRLRRHARPNGQAAIA